jgi:hypothetical protein
MKRAIRGLMRGAQHDRGWAEMRYASTEMSSPAAVQNPPEESYEGRVVGGKYRVG